MVIDSHTIRSFKDKEKNPRQESKLLLPACYHYAEIMVIIRHIE